MNRAAELARSLANAEKQRDEWRIEFDKRVAALNTNFAELQASKARIAGLEKELQAAKAKTEAAERVRWEAQNKAQELTNQMARLDRALSECERLEVENVLLAKLNRLLARRLSQALLGAHLDEVPK